MAASTIRFRKIVPLLPLLVLYLILAIFAGSDTLIGDEKRHAQFATNLTNGFFTKADNPNLRNGPGYPMVLAPFVSISGDWVYARMLNALFFFFAIYFLHSALRLYVGKQWALFGAYVLGLYPPGIRWALPLYSEAMAIMLLCGFIYFTCLALQAVQLRWKAILGASFFMGSLLLTKVIFFNVLAVSAFLLLLLQLFKRKSELRKLWLILAGSLIMASPYLIYAYHITDKLFYLGTGGGEILYHRSTPYENEWGNWFSMDNVLGLGADEKEQPNVYSDLSELRKNHGPLYRKIQHLSYMERDSALRAEAFKNMKAHPRKYLQNTAASLSRFMFNFPSSYRTQNLNAVAYIIPNAFLLLCFVLAMFIIILRKKTLPFEIWCILIMSLIYGGGMVMLSGKGRYFIMMFPGLMLSSAYVLWHYQHISLITGRKK